jgi:hypothetical protein
MTSKKARSRQPDELRPEYDIGALKHAVRGKYHARAIAGSNVVLLDADVAEVFPTAESVNEALRLLLTLARKKVNGSKRSRRSA